MKWISLEDEYPQPYVGVIVTDGFNVWSALYYKFGWVCHGYEAYDMSAEFGKPTYWMPLPKPPKIGENKE